MTFKFENCAFKHFVRVNGWLPVCKSRKKLMDASFQKEKEKRRLKYFTFCAEGALDVFLLNKAKIINFDDKNGFSSVVFFDKDDESVARTSENIPGAIGFPGDFITVVLGGDVPEPGGDAELESPEDLEDTSEVRGQQRLRDIRKKFHNQFPFDVINLDVETYPWKPREELPGKLLNAIRQILEWQKRKNFNGNNIPYRVSSFDLMFTTRLGPANLPADQIERLKGRINQNLEMYPDAAEAFRDAHKVMDADELFDIDFDAAFKIAIPKSLADLAVECGWYVDADLGVRVFEFERDETDPSYTMLHLVMTLHRQNPPVELRLPKEPLPEITERNHAEVVKKVLSQKVERLNDILIDDKMDEVAANLETLFQHRDRMHGKY